MQDWEIPTLRMIAEDPPSFGGLRHQHLSLVVCLGLAPSLVLLYVVVFSDSTRAVIAVAVAALVSIPALLVAIRHFAKSDPYFIEHLTTHRYPAVRYLGK